MWKILLDKNGNKIGTKILNLKNTLLNGQSFNWKIAESSLEKVNDPNHRIEYIGYIGKRVLLLKEDYASFESKSLKPNGNSNLNSPGDGEKEKFIFYKFLNLNSVKFTPEDYLDIKTLNKQFNPEKRDKKANNKKHNLTTIDQINSSIKTPQEQIKFNSLNNSPNETTITNHTSAAQSNYSLNSATRISVDSELLNNLILDYFQMEVDLEQILNDIAPKLPSHLGNVIKKLEGVRIIKQDVFECTLSFICSSNNNIERIRKMLLSLREQYGELILDDPIYGKINAFPTLENLLSKTSEEKLRKLGFGYRAKYIVNSLNYIEQKGLNWLYSLESKEEPWKELVCLTGVGRKVADCISLFSLKKHKIVPLDIHMIKFYNETVVKLDKKYKKIESLGKQVYEEVSKIYSDTFGDHAGWVHSVFYLNRVDKSKPDYLKENLIQEESVKLKVKGKKHDLGVKVGVEKTGKIEVMGEEANLVKVEVNKGKNLKGKKLKAESVKEEILIVKKKAKKK